MSPKPMFIGIAALSAVLAVPGLARAQSSCAGVSPTSNTTLTSVTVASGLSNPLFVASPPGDTARIFIVQQGGIIKIHKRGTSASTLTTFIDIASKITSGSELGLLGLAFDPDYQATRAFYVNYNETVSGQIYTVVARYTASVANPDLGDIASEVRILRFAQPENNHNGGMLMFGPDGFLYVFTGDGGGGGDAHGTCGNAQNQNVLLGKILRIDPRGIDPSATNPDCGLAGANYKIPATNPFRDGAGTGTCDEIWDYGFRNPWRSSFDAANGDLYIGDVGENCWEEIDWVPSTSTGGENFGWRQMEGLHCYNPSQTGTCTPAGAVCGGSPACNDPSIRLPVVEYSHTGSVCAVTGGYVYRGCKMSNYQGTYFYGDYCAGFVKTLVMAGGVATNVHDVTSQVDPGATLPNKLTSFGVDAQGELYVAGKGGSVLKIVPPFADLEVSALGSGAPLLLDKTGSWTWENLFVATESPVSFYRVYRGSIAGAYACVLKTATPVWPGGGDPASPAPDQVFAYVVTAVGPTGSESKPGTTGTFNATTCP